MPESNTKRALVADDYGDIRKGVRAMLESLGFEVIEARDGQEAIEKAEELMRRGVSLDLAVLDYFMPHHKGDVVMVTIRKAAEKYGVNPPVMAMLTGSKDGDLVSRTQAAGLGKMFLKGTAGFSDIRDWIVGKPAIAM